MGWITAQVLRYSPEDGTYDLDVKSQVPPQSVFALKPGQRVEYHSASSNSWIPAAVVREGSSPGTFDLDCKDGVIMSRIRPPQDYVPPSGPTSSRGGSGGYSYNGSTASPYGGGGGGGGLGAIPESGLPEGLRQAKMDQLRSAVNAENPEELRRRLESTSALHLVGEDLNMANHKLRLLEARPEAERDLRSALQSGKKAHLEIAIEAAMVCEADPALIEAAKQALQRTSVSPMWRYDAGDGHHIDVRQRPQIDGPRVRKRLEAGDVFCVTEERAGPEGVTYLQLADGRGWLFDRKPGFGSMCQRYTYDRPDGPGLYIIIHDDTAVTPTEAVAADAILTKLPARTVVRVTQVSRNMAANRVRGKLENPMGWISLLDMESGLRWAIQHADASARMM